MLVLGTPYAKSELLRAFSAEHVAVHQFFSAVDDALFFERVNEEWSSAENLAHLTLSSKPIVLALTLPRPVLRLRFGKADHPSTSVAAIRTHYTQVALAGGGVAGGAYLPKINQRNRAEREKLLREWRETGIKLEAALEKWREDDLDRLTVPHPLIGKLTMREILFFTLYHNLHHVRDVQRMLDMPESEWFDPTLLPTKDIS